MPEAGATRAPSRRPYLLRAMHEWIADCGQTPHVIVDAALEGVEVPRAYVKENRIVLNLSTTATQHLSLGNDFLEFSARFSGVIHRVKVPMAAVLGIYARETGAGMVFPDEDQGPGGEPPEGPGDGPGGPAGEEKAEEKARRRAPRGDGRPSLKVVK